MTEEVLQRIEKNAEMVQAPRADWLRELVAEVRRARLEGYGKISCRLKGCGGWIGPDLTGRPMCYLCGPRDMRRLGLHDVLELRRAERERCIKAAIAALCGDDACEDFLCEARRAASAIRALPDEP